MLKVLEFYYYLLFDRLIALKLGGGVRVSQEKFIFITIQGEKNPLNFFVKKVLE
jgi:hypothetical protein